MNSKVISFHYTLTDPTGTVLDTSDGDDPMSFLAGVGQIIPGLEKVLAEMKTGDQKKVTVKAEDAYGARDKAKLIDVPIERLPNNKIKVGDRFQLSGEPNSMPLTVTKVTEKHVTLDSNHPLAGMDLTFDVKITEVRNATDEEMAHGHAHGAGGHHH